MTQGKATRAQQRTATETRSGALWERFLIMIKVQSEVTSPMLGIDMHTEFTTNSQIRRNDQESLVSHQELTKELGSEMSQDTPGTLETDQQPTKEGT